MGDYVGYQKNRRFRRKQKKKASSATAILNSNKDLMKDDGIGSRTCMPFFQMKQSKHASPTVPLTEQSDDWEEDENNLLAHSISPEQPLLPPETWQPPPEQASARGGNLSLESSMSSVYTDSQKQLPNQDLLTLPTPTYRGRGSRRASSEDNSSNAASGFYSPQQFLPSVSSLSSSTSGQHRRRRRSPVYEGEQEPEGIRGQEATPTPKSTRSSMQPLLPSMRTFGPDSPQQHKRSSDNNNNPFVIISPLSEIANEDDDSESFPPYRADHQDTSSSSALDQIDEESTQSSIDIARMRNDLVPDSPERSNHNNDRPQEEPGTPNTQDFMQMRSVLLNKVTNDYEADSSSDDSSVEEGQNVRQPRSAAVNNNSSSRPLLQSQQQQESYSSYANVNNYSSVTYESLVTTSSAAPSSINSSNDDTADTPASNQAVFGPGGGDANPFTLATKAQPVSATAMKRRQLQAARQQEAAAEAAAAAAHAMGAYEEQPPERQMHEVQIDELHAAAVRHVELGEYNHALGLFEIVLEAYMENYGKIHPLVASTRHNLGLVHSKRAALMMDGTFRQEALMLSLKNFQAAARCARDSLGPEHPNVAASLVRIGFLLMDCKEYEKAVVTFEEALRIRLAHYGPHHSLVANLWNDLGVCHTHLQNWDDAMTNTTRALQTQRNLLDISPQIDDKMQLEIADTLCNLGGLYLERMQHDDDNVDLVLLLEWARHAVSAFCEALDIRMHILGEASHPLVVQARSLHDMAQTSLRQLKRKHLREKSKCVPSIKRGMSESYADEDDLSSRFFQDGGPPTDGSFEIQRGAYTVPIVDDVSPPAVVSPHSSPPLPLQEVMVDPDLKVSESLDEVDSLGESASPRRVPDGSTKIWVSPHVIPTRSPPQDSNSSTLPFLEDFYQQQQEVTPDRMPRRRERTYSYDAEDSCLIGTDAEEELFASPRSDFELVEGEDTAEQPFESRHEIMVVQPSNSFDEKAVQPLVSRKTISWAQAAQQQAPSSNADSPALTFHEQDSMFDFDGSATAQEYYSEADSGGGPASITEQRPVVNVTREMMEEPEAHLEDIHSAATRYLRENRLHEAIILFETILQCQRNKHGELHEEVGSALHNVGLVHLRAERHVEALDAFEKAVRVRKGSVGRDHPDVAVSLVKVGITRLLLHRFEMSLMAFRDALSIRRHALGALHPSLARIYNNIGVVHLEFNEVQEARRAFEGALDIQRNALCEEPESGPLMFGTATTLCNLGFLYKSRGMHGKAAVIFKEAVNLQEVVLGPKHPTVLSTLDSLADSNTKCNNCATALKCYYEILERFPAPEDFAGRGASLNRRKRAEAVILYKMSRTHRKQNDRESELEKLHAALEMVQQIVSSTSTNNEELTDRLERGIQNDIKRVQDDMARSDLEWI